MRYFDRVYFQTSTTGTGDISVGQGLIGYVSLDDAGAVSGDTLPYVIEQDGDWEIGFGVYDGSSLSRNVQKSSLGGQKINLSGQAKVFCPVTSQSVSASGAVTPEQYGAKSGLVLCPEARAVVDKMIADGSAPTVNHAWLIERTIRRLKRALIWDKLGVVLVAGKDKTQSLVNWADTSKSFTETSTMPFAGPGKGWAPDGTGGLVSGPAFSSIANYQLDNAHLSLWQLDKDAEDNSPVWGSNSGEAYLIPRRSSDRTAFRKRINQGSSTDSTIEDDPGHLLSNRISSAHLRNYQNGVYLDEDDEVSTSIPPDSIAIMGDGQGTFPFLSAGGAVAPDRDLSERGLAKAFWYIVNDLVDELPTAVQTGETVTQEMLDSADAIDAAANTVAIQRMIDDISGGSSVGRFGPMTYPINTSLRAFDNVKLEGFPGRTRIQMDASVDREFPVLWTGEEDKSARNIHIDGIIFDANLRTTTDGSGSVVNSAASGSAVALVYTLDSTISRCQAWDPYKHCIDIAGSRYYRSGVSGSPNVWWWQMSQRVKVLDCIAEGAGDDFITTHTCYDVLIRDCYARFASSRYSGTTSNNNAYEVDDYSRHVTIENCQGEFCFCLVEVKGHNDAKAAEDVRLLNLTSKYTQNGLVIRHDDHGASGEPVSNGKNIFIDNLRIIAPMQWVPSGTRQGIRVYSYKNVLVGSCLFEQLDSEDNYYGSGGGSDGVVSVFWGAGDITFNSIQINGFPESNGLRFSGSGEGPITVANLITNNGPYRAVYLSSGGTNLTLGNLSLSGPGTSGSVGIDADGASNNLIVSNGSSNFISNYEQETNAALTGGATVCGMMYNVDDWVITDDGIVPFQSSFGLRGGMSFEADVSIEGGLDVGSVLKIPTSGLYQVSFQVSWSVDTVSSGDGILFEVQRYIPGSAGEGDNLTDNELRVFSTFGSAVGDENSVSNMFLAELNADDEVYMRVTSVGSSGATMDYGNLSLVKL